MKTSKSIKINNQNTSNDRKFEKEITPSTYILGGFSKLPANAILPDGSSNLAIEIEIDPYDNCIIDFSCDCLPGIGNKFLIALLLGKTVDESLKNAMVEIRKRYFSIIQRALIAALEDVQRRFHELQREKLKKR